MCPLFAVGMPAIHSLIQLPNFFPQRHTSKQILYPLLSRKEMIFISKHAVSPGFTPWMSEMD
jgi:hypothetical protein